MMRQFSADFFNTVHATGCKITVPKMRFHLRANRAPARLSNMLMDAAIRNYFHATIRQQHINKHAVIGLGIPHAEQGKNIQRALT